MDYYLLKSAFISQKYVHRNNKVLCSLGNRRYMARNSAAYKRMVRIPVSQTVAQLPGGLYQIVLDQPSRLFLQSAVLLQDKHAQD